MYELNIKGEKVNVLDYYELARTVDIIKEEKEEFHLNISKIIEKIFNRIKIKPEEELKEFIFTELIKGQILIERILFYLIRGTEKDFKKYYENFEISNKELKKIYSNLKSNTKKEKISEYFSYEELSAKYKEYEEDKMGVFYYFVFTMLYLEDYLLKYVSNFDTLFEKSSFSFEETQNLHMNFAKIFSEDFSKAFYLFEKDYV